MLELKLNTLNNVDKKILKHESLFLYLIKTNGPMYQEKPKDTIIKKLRIDDSYSDFPEFYLKNKEEIYKNVFLSFKSINRKDKENVILQLSAKINELQWETEFKFNKKECFVLIRDILPFFEDKEDYEYCEQILNLYNKLNTNNQ